MNIQGFFRIDWFDLLTVQGMLKSFLQHHSSKASILSCSAFFTVQLSHPDVSTGWTVVDKVVSLLFNILSRFVIAFLLRNKHLLISWQQSPSTVILEPRKVTSVTASTFSPSVYCEMMEWDAMILAFLMLSFKPAFSLSSFTLIKRVFSSSLFSAIRVESFAYLRLLIFFPAILIPACASSSPAFHLRYSARMLNKQNENIQPCHTSFPILNQSGSNC